MITPNIIREASPCAAGWKTLITAWGGRPMDAELSIGDVMISNGLDDALWCLRFVTPQERVAAILPAVKRASAFTKDARVHDCMALLDAFVATGNSEGLKDAANAAYAAYAAATAAYAAARATAYAADAAYAAARATAYAAERAVDAAAYAAADAAAYAAYSASDAAAYAARATVNAASDAAEREQQRADLLAAFPPKVFTP